MRIISHSIVWFRLAPLFSATSNLAASLSDTLLTWQLRAIYLCAIKYSVIMCSESAWNQRPVGAAKLSVTWKNCWLLASNRRAWYFAWPHLVTVKRYFIHSRFYRQCQIAVAYPILANFLKILNDRLWINVYRDRMRWYLGVAMEILLA